MVPFMQTQTPKTDLTSKLALALFAAYLLVPFFAA